MKKQNPPEQHYSPRKSEAIADELRANPGDWFLYAENVPSSNAYQGVVKRVLSFGGFERRVVCAGKKGDLCDIYLRYVGEASS